MSISYGTSGIKQKDYQVYLGEYDSTLAGKIATFKTTSNETNLRAIAKIDNADAGTLLQLGELRADSISVTADDGDSVEGNNVGNIVLNKACAMVAELINATPNNINELEGMDGKNIAIIVLEKGVHLDGATKKKTAIVINNVVMSYSENITGGDIPRATVNIARNTATVSDFRFIVDVTWA